MITLEGKKILVLGGSSGLGLATAKAAANAGGIVTIASRSEEKLAAAAKEIGKNTSTKKLDATDNVAVSDFFATSGAWDHIVCSAGAGGRGSIKDISLEDAMTAMNSKFWSYFRVAKAATMAPGGSITFVSGLLSHRPSAGAAVISAVNAAIEGMAMGLALDFAPIRVNTVCPGSIDTPQWDRMPEPERKAMYARKEETLPVRRMGQSEDVAHGILFAMTNPYTTGTVVIIDGGSLISGT